MMTNKQLAWDHNTIGSPITIHPRYVKPLTVLLKEQTIGVGCRYLSSSNCEHGMFNATVGVDKNGEGLVISVDKFNESVDAQRDNILLCGDIAVPCVFHQRAVCMEERTTNDLVGCLKRLHASVSNPQQVSLSRCASLRLHLHLVGPNCKVHLEALTPGVTFRAAPVPPLPILPTALSQSMVAAGEQANFYKTGFLSMDQSKKVMLLLENDPRVNTCPIIGIWVSGVETVVHPMVWAACLRFISCPSYAQRVVRPEEPFLLVVYSSLFSVPEFYDCLTSKPSASIPYTLLEGHAQLVVTKVPSFSSRVCFAELTPVENPKKLKIFEDACGILHRDTSPLPYSQDKLMLPPSDYPRRQPTPHQMAFVLKPSVPDLSLLSECSRILQNTQQLSSSSQSSPGLDECISSKTESCLDQQVLAVTVQVSRSDENLVCSSKVAPSTVEHVPRQAGTATYNNLCFEALQLLELRKSLTADIRVEQKSGDLIKQKDPEKEVSSQQVANSLNSSSSGDAGGADEINYKMKESRPNKRPEHKDRAPSHSVAQCDSMEKDTESFKDFQIGLREKEMQLREIQEQVKTLLTSQRDHLRVWVSPMSEVQPDIAQKIDRQNEQLQELKAQIQVLLENQQASATLPQRVQLNPASKCSVGVMTSFWGYSEKPLSGAPDDCASPCLKDKVLVRRVASKHNVPEYQRLAGVSDGSRNLSKILVKNAPNLGNDLVNTTDSFITNATQQLCCNDNCNCGFHHYRGRRDVVCGNIGENLKNSSIGKCGVTPLEGKGKPHGISKTSCGCELPEPPGDFSIEKMRELSIRGEDFSRASSSLRLNLTQASLPAHSVDASLPLGASVSMMEISPKNMENKGWERESQSEEEELGSFQIPGTTFYRHLQMQVDQLIQNQPIRRNRSSDLPIKEKRSRRRNLLRLSLDNDAFPLNNQRPQNWDGSVLLPSLNYQTLCLSDESDSELSQGTEKLSEKYLGVQPTEQRSYRTFQEGQKWGELEQQEPRRKPGAQLVSQRKRSPSFSIEASKNMSFATKAYLQRHGLAPKF